jgi:hypothetical protein
MKYYIGNYPILTPNEIVNLCMIVEKPQAKSEFLYYVSTGMRYNEGQFILDNIDSVDIEARIIHYKSNKRWDRERLWKDRDIYLSYWDIMNVKNYITLNTKHRTNPKHRRLSKNMINWANYMGLDPMGVGSRCLRKTRFVWLLKSYPEYEDEIIKSMDYNPSKNALIDASDDYIDDYIAVPFTSKEISFAKALLHGWSGAPEK